MKLILKILLFIKKILKSSQLDNKYFAKLVDTKIIPAYEQNKLDLVEIYTKYLPVEIRTKLLAKLPSGEPSSKALAKLLKETYNKYF